MKKIDDLMRELQKSKDSHKSLQRQHDKAMADKAAELANHLGRHQVSLPFAARLT